MKLKHVLATLGLSSVMALGVGVAVAKSAPKGIEKAQAISLADDMTFYYIDNWGLGTPYFYEFNSNDDKPGAYPGVLMTDTGDTFEYEEGHSAKVFSFVADAATYGKFIINGGEGKSQTKDLQWSWYASFNGNAFLHVYDSGESMSLTDYASFSIVVDSVTTPLIRNWSNTSETEYTLAADASFVPAKPIEIQRNGAAYAFTMKANINNNYNNGSIVDSKIVVHNAATTNLYLNADTAQVWVGGFEFDDSQDIPVYLLASGMGDMYMYTYDTSSSSKSSGVFPGVQMTAFTGIGYYNGGVMNGIYKATFHGESTDTTFIFHDNSGIEDQYHRRTTSRLDLSGSDYTSGFGPGAGNPGNRTAAFEALYRLQELLAVIPANVDAGTVQGSTCGITKAYAQTIIDEMDVLTTGMYPYVQNELENSTIYLVSQKDGSAHDNYTYAQIMDALDLVASGASRVVIPTIETNNTALIVVVVSTITTISVVGAFFIIRRRKHQ